MTVESRGTVATVVEMLKGRYAELMGYLREAGEIRQSLIALGVEVESPSPVPAAALNGRTEDPERVSVDVVDADIPLPEPARAPVDDGRYVFKRRAYESSPLLKEVVKFLRKKGPKGASRNDIALHIGTAYANVANIVGARTDLFEESGDTDGAKSRLIVLREGADPTDQTQEGCIERFVRDNPQGVTTGEIVKATKINYYTLIKRMAEMPKIVQIGREGRSPIWGMKAAK